MAIDRGILERLRTRGEEVLTQLSAELSSNPRFVKAVQGALERASRGREALEQAAAKALHEMNVSTRGDLRRANSRIEVLEREVANLRSRARAGARGGAKPAGRGRAAAKPASRARAKAAGRRTE